MVQFTPAGQDTEVLTGHLPGVVREVLGHVQVHRHVVTVVGVAPLALHHSHLTSLGPNFTIVLVC